MIACTAPLTIEFKTESDDDGGGDYDDDGGGGDYGDDSGGDYDDIVVMLQSCLFRSAAQCTRRSALTCSSNNVQPSRNNSAR